MRVDQEKGKLLETQSNSVMWKSHATEVVALRDLLRSDVLLGGRRLVAGPCLRMDFGLCAAECTRGTDDAVATTQKPIQMVEQHKEQHQKQKTASNNQHRDDTPRTTRLDQLPSAVH